MSGELVMMPNFLIIGSTKSGTTSLYHYLRQHPDIYMSPVKEPHFFACAGGGMLEPRGPGDQTFVQQNVVRELSDYQELFAKASDEAARGEASAMYLYYPHAAANIRRHVSDIKLIAILRHPVDRAYSSFLHLRRDNREIHEDFAEALRAEEARIDEQWLPLWHYRRMGFYHEQLKRYFACFPKQQLRIYLYEDFKERPAEVIQDIFGFLGVDDGFAPDTALRHNVSGLPESGMIRRSYDLVVGSSKVKSALKTVLPPGLRQSLKGRVKTRLQMHHLSKPPLASALRSELTTIYREDILKVQELIDRDLTAWLAP